MPEKKLDILKALARREKSLNGLKNRLTVLHEILENKQPNYEADLILSTIHSSKGLEYDTVYIIDEVTGSFPVKDQCDYTDIAEAMEYEEERRLFYVGITRAKNNLKLFDFGMDSPFIRELKIKGVKIRMPIISKRTTQKVRSNEYNETLKKIKETKRVKHKIYGRGEVLSIQGDIANIKFKEKTGKFSLPALISGGIISV